MSRARDLLQRFRPAGTPGAAARRGVPEDRIAALSAELEPVLVLLSGSLEQAGRIRDEGRAAAEQRRRAATEQAQSLVSAARGQAEAVRAEAASRISRTAAREAAADLADAKDTASELRRRGTERVPDLADQVAAEVKARLGVRAT
jgi:hypothetical protein